MDSPEHQRTDFHRWYIAFKLNEALCAVRGCSRRLTEDADEPALCVDLANITWQLCHAWHALWAVEQEILERTTDNYLLKAVSVPNWGGRFQLVEWVIDNPRIDLRLARSKVTRETLQQFMQTVETTLHALLQEPVNGQPDLCDERMLSGECERMLHTLCLAWHLRHLTPTELATTDSVTIDDIGYCLPNWDVQFQLVPDHSPPARATRL